MKPVLSEAGFAAAAQSLNCEVAAIKAVCQVEAPKGGFLADDRVRILFERHKFYKFTGGKLSPYRATHPDICNPAAGGYGAEGAHQYERFSRAFALDPKAAMKSCSWGKFQIMGFNFASAGFDTLDAFVNAMKESEDAQLTAFVKIVKSFALADELRRHDWAGFARGYNGENYKINAYDVKLAAAYRRHRNDAPAAAAPAVDDDSTVGHSIVDDLVPVEVEAEAPPAVGDIAEAEDQPKQTATAAIASGTAVRTETGAVKSNEGAPKEVKAATPSIQTRITAIMAWAMGIGTATWAVLVKGIQYLTEHPGLIVLISVFATLGFLVWAWSTFLANKRTIAIAGIQADQNKNDVIIT